MHTATCRPDKATTWKFASPPLLHSFTHTSNYELDILHGFDVNNGDNFVVNNDAKKHGHLETQLGYTGALPLTCVQECVGDPNCHGACYC